MGIDLGSTSLKAIVYDLDGNKVAGGSQPTERFHPAPAHPEWTVWQPEQIWGGTAGAIREAARAGHGLAGVCGGVGGVRVRVCARARWGSCAPAGWAAG